MRFFSALLCIVYWMLYIRSSLIESAFQPGVGGDRVEARESPPGIDKEKLRTLLDQESMIKIHFNSGRSRLILGKKALDYY